MPMTLFEAPPYDPRRAQRRKAIVTVAIASVLLLAALAYAFRNLPYERIVDHFFDALEQKDFEAAYGIWLHDPHWKQNQAKHTNYSFHDFYVDWGPGGEWGIIQSHRIVGSAAPKGGSGVVVVVKVNERAEEARIWVERKDKTLTFSPY